MVAIVLKNVNSIWLRGPGPNSAVTVSTGKAHTHIPFATILKTAKIKQCGILQNLCENMRPMKTSNTLGGRYTMSRRVLWPKMNT